LEVATYDEVRQWFWFRTWLWTVAACIASVMAYFAYLNGLVEAFATRMWLSVGVGVAVTLIGMLAAFISLQFAWMRGGWRLGFVLNGPACAAIGALTAFLLCGVILTFMQNDPLHPPPANTVHVTYTIMRFSVVVAALWGFIYGSWFAMRLDKYFVEQI